MSEEPKYKPFELVVITKRDIGKTERILLDDNRQFQIKENHLWFVKTDEKTGRYNIIIACLTVVISVLTLVMVIKMFIR